VWTCVCVLYFSFSLSSPCKNDPKTPGRVAGLLMMVPPGLCARVGGLVLQLLCARWRRKVGDGE
jgi:hypothetical protein